MAGIISNALSSGQTAYSADTNPYAATTRTVDPTKTVSGQLTDILSQDSPYIQQARSAALDTANSRGLLNTSMAAGAGESAAISAALPIAQGNANLYDTAAQQNQGYENQAGQFNAGATNTSNLQEAQAANTSALSGQGSTQDIALQTLRGTQSTNLANIEANYKDLMQTSASASQMLTQTSKNIADILADPNTSQDQKQNAVDNQTGLLNSSLSVVGAIANVDLGGLLNFSATAK